MAVEEAADYLTEVSPYCTFTVETASKTCLFLWLVGLLGCCGSPVMGLLQDDVGALMGLRGFSDGTGRRDKLRCTTLLQCASAHRRVCVCVCVYFFFFWSCCNPNCFIVIVHLRIPATCAPEFVHAALRGYSFVLQTGVSGGT